MSVSRRVVRCEDKGIALPIRVAPGDNNKILEFQPTSQDLCSLANNMRILSLTDIIWMQKKPYQD